MKTLHRASLLACATLVTCALTSCSWFSKDEKTKETPRPQLVGRIASIPAGRTFVLIQSYGKWEVPTGTILTTRGPDERAANLLVTGESVAQYAAADLQSGTVEIGDAVYQLPKPSTKPSTPKSDSNPPLDPEPTKIPSESPENKASGENT
jgi:hypothetical protein